MSTRQEMMELDRPSHVDDTRERLLAGIPVAERQLNLAGISTAVLERGEGPPIVLLHSSGEFAALWMRVIPDLAVSHRVIAPDLPGHGASAPGDGKLDTGRVLAWLDELIGQTCPAPPILVGHGLGGAMAARFAAAYSDRLRRLVLVDSFGLAPFEPEQSFGTAMSRFLEEPTERTRDDLFRQCFVDLIGLREQLGETWSLIAAYALDRMRAPGMGAALGSLMPTFGMPPIATSDLMRIDVPVTLIWGRHDLQVPLRIAEAAATCYGWPLHVIENAGDDPAMEQPKAFLEALRAALAQSTATEVTP